MNAQPQSNLSAFGTTLQSTQNPSATDVKNWSPTPVQCQTDTQSQLSFKAQFDDLFAFLMSKKKQETEKLDAIRAERRVWWYTLRSLLTVG